ncbi:MAG: hypothetical protein HC904_16885 [Blastochloris sp.]|nr:hypothetical protein [Blastochloris sp.]
MKVIRAKQMGMCFGVRDALVQVEKLAQEGETAVLGALVHNPVLREQLREAGVHELDPEQEQRARPERVHVITAHGVSEKQRMQWKLQGLRLHDTTCPLVHRAHVRLAELVGQGLHPVVIGTRTHVEVRGLIGDYPEVTVIGGEEDLGDLPEKVDLGVIAQTTQPLEQVLKLLEKIRARAGGRRWCFATPCVNRPKIARRPCAIFVGRRT